MVINNWLANSNHVIEVQQEKVKTGDTVKTQMLNFRFFPGLMHYSITPTRVKINYLSKRASCYSHATLINTCQVEGKSHVNSGAQNELQTVKKLIFKLSAGFFCAIKSLIWSHCSSFFQENRNLTCTTSSWTLLFRTPLAVSQRERIHWGSFFFFFWVHWGSLVSFAMYFQPPF